MSSYELIQHKSIQTWLLSYLSIQTSHSKQHCIFIQFNQLICTQMKWSIRDIPWLAHDHPTCKLQLNYLQTIKYIQWITNNLNLTLVCWWHLDFTQFSLGIGFGCALSFITWLNMWWTMWDQFNQASNAMVPRIIYPLFDGTQTSLGPLKLGATYLGIA